MPEPDRIEEEKTEQVPSPENPIESEVTPSPTIKKKGVNSHNYDNVRGGMTTDTGRFQSN